MIKNLILRSLLLLIAISVSSLSSAQMSDRELEKEISNRAMKEARKESKKLKREGWKVTQGSMPLEKLLENSWKMQLQINEDGSQKYLFADGNGVAQSRSVAEMQSIELAKLQLISTLQSNISSLVSTNIGNAQLSTKEAASVTEIIQSAKNIISAKLGYINPVFKIYRDVGSSNVESQVRIFYNSEESMNITKKALQEELKNKMDINEQKLEKLLGF